MSEENIEYELKLQGCDDSTTIKLALSPDRFEFVSMLAAKFESASSYSCEPTLRVRVAPEDTEDWLT